MGIHEEDERNIEDNEIPEKETDWTEDKQATELQDSTVVNKLDESRKTSIISMFIYNIINNYIHICSNVFYMNTVCVEILTVLFICQFWVQTIKLKFTN